ncbi:hypothetical protein AWC38_SpisGene24235 [Stylophora pistillata]|uniref:Uncharacterized protein n=1 Tax=Stylophora pistillata TaxID=50429 RepID=A0A2B4R6J1_STYPI|nr:hypothetical protein AWC38_SpisGene24235 [Stylophora pistillata]
MGIPDQEHSAPSKLSETTCYDLAYACSDIICLALPKDLTVHMDVYFNPGLVQRRTDHLRSSLLAISAVSDLVTSTSIKPSSNQSFDHFHVGFCGSYFPSSLLFPLPSSSCHRPLLAGDVMLVVGKIKKAAKARSKGSGRGGRRKTAAASNEERNFKQEIAAMTTIGTTISIGRRQSPIGHIRSAVPLFGAMFIRSSDEEVMTIVDGNIPQDSGSSLTSHNFLQHQGGKVDPGDLIRAVLADKSALDMLKSAIKADSQHAQITKADQGPSAQTRATKARQPLDPEISIIDSNPPKKPRWNTSNPGASGSDDRSIDHEDALDTESLASDESTSAAYWAASEELSSFLELVARKPVTNFERKTMCREYPMQA